jgi:hypothetical protein
MKPKYGFVALLDTLGQKTATMSDSEAYLKKIDEIRLEVESSLHGTLDDKDIDPLLFKDLSIHFFGDSILITYEIADRNAELDYYRRIVFLLRGLICFALTNGLLIRGSLALGEFIDKDGVVLGPAVSDVATWYEALDSIGVINDTLYDKCGESHHAQENSNEFRIESLYLVRCSSRCAPAKVAAINQPFCAELGYVRRSDGRQEQQSRCRTMVL